MRTRALACILATALASTSLPTVGFAQMDADTKEAKTLFEDGVKLYKAGSYEEARVKFKAAYGLKRRPSIVLNLGHAELQTKRPLDAAGHFREVIAMADAKQDDKDDAKIGLADARKQLGVIDVEAPAGSTVSLDGTVVASVEGGVDVMPGAHTVSVKSSSGKEYVEKVTVSAGGSVTVKGEAPPLPPPPDPTTTTTTTTAPPPGDTTTSTSAVPPPGDTGAPPAKDTAPESGHSPGFFASIHPVTYVAAGATVVFGALWIGYYSAFNTHNSNADVLATAIQQHPRSSSLSSWKTQGREEVSAADSDKTLALVFGIGTLVAATATVVTFITMRKKSDAPTVAFGAAPTWGGGTFVVSGAF